MESKHSRHSMADQGFHSLSIKDLIEARDAYHVHLMNHPRVVATALGRYRIQRNESRPDASGNVKNKGHGPRTLGSSDIRSYSWPAILVFVDKWIEAKQFSSGGTYEPDQMVPRTLYLPDGRRVPVCVILAEKSDQSAPAPSQTRFPLNNIGGGYPVIADVQGREHCATVSCLVTDGHRTFALTNRHVAGVPGEVLYSQLNGQRMPIGRSSEKQLSKLPLSEVYPTWASRNLYVNLDAGLIDIANLDPWTASIRDVGTAGPLVDMSVSNFNLALIGLRVTGIGAVTGKMEGEISALHYRYKSVGGFEYISEFLIGPRSRVEGQKDGNSPEKASQLLTHPGDSGALWLVDPFQMDSGPSKADAQPTSEYRPLCIQWGEQIFGEDGQTSYALATSLSSICRLLDVDFVRDWNLDQPNTWGTVGHFSIAASVSNCLTNTKLKTLMSANADIISPSKDEIKSSEFKGFGSADFVPLADVPDLYWKPRIAKQGFARALEGPNHFADMDQPRESDGKTLLDLTRSDGFIDPKKWDEFYSSINDILSGEPIAAVHRGTLPFRVWQIFNEMVRFAEAGKVAEFVCAAGVLTHYIGDACQPLHISYLHDGDPEHPTSSTVNHKDGTSEEKTSALGAGVHSAYEDAMVSAHRKDILNALVLTPKVKVGELVDTGFDGAKATIQLMRTVFQRIPPRKLVDFYVASDAKPKQLAEDMWDKFGKGTIECMQDGVHLLAVLWQSAWIAGKAEKKIPASALKALTQQKAMKVCQDKGFLPSLPISKIGSVLK